MKLIMRNSSTNEFLPGCDYTVVDIDGDLMDAITKRGKTFLQMQALDPSLWQIRFWDWRPCLINAYEGLDAVVPDVGTSFDEWIESQGGWVVVDVTLSDDAVVSTDCRTMTITVEGPETEVGWVFNLKDSPEVIRTAVVNLTELERRLAAATSR